MIGVYVIEPVYLLGSTPPKTRVSSPLPLEREVVGVKEIPTTSDEILPWENKLSLTVRISEFG